MKIAILASEGAPYAKSGGLGDVMEALPAALAKIPGNEVVLILPYYKKSWKILPIPPRPWQPLKPTWAGASSTPGCISS